MLRTLRKNAYKKSYEFASACQSNYFKEYMYKYLNKHIKYRTKNTMEYKELVDLNDIKKDEFFQCKLFLTKVLKNIVDMLLKINVTLYKASKNDYGVDLYIDKNEVIIMNECVNILKTRLVKYEVFNSEIDNVLKDVVEYSFRQRKGFVTSDAIAKAKVQEHWISRLPIFVFCVTCLLIVKILDIGIHYKERYSYLKLMIIIMVYFISIMMVYLRVYQTILSDTKKTASEEYKKSKRALYNNFAIQTSENNLMCTTSEDVRSMIRECLIDEDCKTGKMLDV